jgi:AcrR family transcriptional regulator
MYQGTNKTAQKSQDSIVKALIHLMKATPYSSISVSAICKEAGISRQTFYTLFESRENIILYELSRKHCFHPGDSCPEKKITLKEICDEYAAYITEKEEILTLLADNRIIFLMHDSLYTSFLSCSCCSRGKTESERQFIAEFFASSLSGIARVYTMQQNRPSREDLSEIIYALLSGAYAGTFF